MNSQNYAKCTSGMFSGNNMRLQPGSAFSRNKTFDACFFVFVFSVNVQFFGILGEYINRVRMLKQGHWSLTEDMSKLYLVM